MSQSRLPFLNRSHHGHRHPSFRNTNCHHGTYSQNNRLLPWRNVASCWTSHPQPQVNVALAPTITKKKRRPLLNKKKEIERNQVRQQRHMEERASLKEKLLSFEKSPQPGVRLTESQWERIQPTALVLRLKRVKWDRAKKML